MPRTRPNLSPAPKGSSTAKASSAPKGRNIPAQGNALGSRPTTNPSPEGAEQRWGIVKLEEIADIRSGNGFPIKYQGRTEGEFPFFKVGDISRNWQKGMITLTNGEHCLSQAEVKAIRAKTLPEGSVVFAKIGAAVALNRRAILGVESLVDNNVMALVPSAMTTSRFLFYFMCQVDLGASTRGGAVPSLRRGDVADLDIPLPPLPEQRRIVARIEELFSRLDAGVAALRHAKAQLQRYRQSVLAAAVTGQLTQAWRELHPDTESAETLLERVLKQRREQWDGRVRYKEPIEPATERGGEIPDSWMWTSTDSVCSQITDGEHIQPRYQEEGLPMLSAKHVRDGYVILDGAGLIAPEDFETCLKRCAPVKDDVLIVSVGATTGRTGIVGDQPPFSLVRSVLLLRPLSILPRYLLLWNQSPWIMRWKASASGASAQPHLYIKDTRRMPIALPPLAEQHQIVAEVEARTTAIDHLEAELDRQITRSNRLRQSTLSAAFHGNL